jgi:hypothetical protein
MLWVRCGTPVMPCTCLALVPGLQDQSTCGTPTTSPRMTASRTRGMTTRADAEGDSLVA